MSFKQKVVYQIYPKSFYDHNGDGFGDLAGIIEKLPYLADLGVEMLWLSPIYPSPQKDNGYDVADYQAIDPRFGTMAIFEQLVAQAKTYGIGIMLDMVFNHVSTEHEWFQRALAGEKKYQDYFLLRDEPTNWQSKFGGSAWAPFGQTGKWYLHLYDVTQADLNWRNPDVRKELQKVLEFWLDKGVEGLRFDVINVIGKDEHIKDAADGIGKAEYTDRPIAHDYIHEMNRATFGPRGTITVGEMSSTTIENGVLYTQETRHELSMIFNFHHLKVDYADGEKWTTSKFDFHQLTQILHEWGEGMSEHDGWNALFWNNHDQPRALNRFVDWQTYRVAGAQVLAAMIHLNRGTPFIYMGEEIGMLNPTYDTIDAFDDIESKNAYQMLLAKGKSASEALAIVQSKSRDNARIPMQWQTANNGGFTTGTPWLAPGDYANISVEQERKNPQIFGFYQRLIQLRKMYPIIAEGSYQGYEKNHSQVFSFIRELGNQKLVVMNNLSATNATIALPDEFLAGQVLISNQETQVMKDMTLMPYQTVAILI